MSAVTPAQRHIMEHATAWHGRYPLFRNHFCAGPDQDSWADLQALVSRGLMSVMASASADMGGMSSFTGHAARHR